MPPRVGDPKHVLGKVYGKQMTGSSSHLWFEQVRAQEELRARTFIEYYGTVPCLLACSLVPLKKKEQHFIPWWWEYPHGFLVVDRMGHSGK